MIDTQMMNEIRERLAQLPKGLSSKQHHHVVIADVDAFVERYTAPSNVNCVGRGPYLFSHHWRVSFVAGKGIAPVCGWIQGDAINEQQGERLHKVIVAMAAFIEQAQTVSEKKAARKVLQESVQAFLELTAISPVEIRAGRRRQRLEFIAPRIKQRMTWRQIQAAYVQQHPDDDASHDDLRHCWNRRNKSDKTGS